MITAMPVKHDAIKAMQRATKARMTKLATGGAKARYQNADMDKTYTSMLTMAADTTSELYWKGQQRNGAIHRCAFWDGFNGVERSGNVTPGTVTWACFQAGKEWKRRQPE
jgi:hypothetical protein